MPGRESCIPTARANEYLPERQAITRLFHCFRHFSAFLRRNSLCVHGVILSGGNSPLYCFTIKPYSHVYPQKELFIQKRCGFCYIYMRIPPRMNQSSKTTEIWGLRLSTGVEGPPVITDLALPKHGSIHMNRVVLLKTHLNRFLKKKTKKKKTVLFRIKSISWFLQSVEMHSRYWFKSEMLSSPTHVKMLKTCTCKSRLHTNECAKTPTLQFFLTLFYPPSPQLILLLSFASSCVLNSCCLSSAVSTACDLFSSGTGYCPSPSSSCINDLW